MGDSEISPLEFSSALLLDQWKSARDEAEFTVMRIKVTGIENEAPVSHTYDLLDYYDKVTGLSSMSRTTGYTCTASLRMMIEGLFQEKGVFPPELVGGRAHCFEFLMKYLADRGVHYRVSKS